MGEDRARTRRIRQHVTAREHRFFAVVQPGFERIAQDELASLGARDAEAVEGGVEFSGRLEDCYRVNLCARTIVRVLMRLTGFRAERFERVREKVAAFPWELYLAPGAPLAVRASARKSRLHHTGRLEEEVRGGIAERMGEGVMPDAARGDEGAQTVFLRFERDRCQVSLDASGALLHKRGYRHDAGEAPLRETTAAAIVLAARADAYDGIIDPMCGSGTLAVEAALIATGLPPGAARGFAFEAWPAFRPAAYRHMKGKILEPLMPPALPRGRSILAFDASDAAVVAARANRDAAGLTGCIDIMRGDFFSLPRPFEGKTLVAINPPYGKRSMAGASVKSLYRRIGAVLRERYADAGYAIIVPGLECEKALGLPYDRKILFMNGGIRVAALIRDARYVT